jgi:hypothetical protein
VLRHPLGPVEVALPCAPRSFWLTYRVDVQHDEGHFVPIRALCVGIQETQVRHQMLLIIWRENVALWRLICDIGIERRVRHDVIPERLIDANRSRWPKKVATAEIARPPRDHATPPGDHPRPGPVKGGPVSTPPSGTALYGGGLS